MAKHFFPHEEVRPIQNELLSDIQRTIEEGGCIIANAPTGLGKTAASLAPALYYAYHNKKIVFFLTSRQTQHTIAIDTIKKIKAKHDVPLTGVDIISRQWMCPVPGTHTLYSREFSDYCKAMREDNKCEWYSKARKKQGSLSVEGQKIVGELKPLLPMNVQEFVKTVGEDKMCPYEIALALSQKADIIVCDYYYIFNQVIQDIFLGKIDKSLSDIILIIDEGHNLPGRIRELMSVSISSYVLSRARKEAMKFSHHDILDYIDGLEMLWKDLLEEMDAYEERKFEKKELIMKISEFAPYQEAYELMEKAGDDIRRKQKQSSIGTIAEFLKAWEGEDKGFARILQRRDDGSKPILTLSYKCLDPSIITKEIIENCHATVIMSGTLTPTDMYRDILGFPKEALEKEYPSPFPKENRKTIIVPSVTTKYTQRNEHEFKKIADVCAEITDTVPGNSVIFFPSYNLLNKVGAYFNTTSKRTIMMEDAKQTKEEREQLLQKFREYKKQGAVLLAVASGSFGEGIDLPNDELKAVLIVGLPLQPPDLETKELINYYDMKFGRGWEYGYTLPAITKILQNAGRCIRTPTDTGVIAFLDNRYLYSNYQKSFPKDWILEKVSEPIDAVRSFYGISKPINNLNDLF
jgi:DNA excision repair protein ERCC-2